MKGSRKEGLEAKAHTDTCNHTISKWRGKKKKKKKKMKKKTSTCKLRSSHNFRGPFERLVLRGTPLANLGQVALQVDD